MLKIETNFCSMVNRLSSVEKMNPVQCFFLFTIFDSALQIPVGVRGNSPAEIINHFSFSAYSAHWDLTMKAFRELMKNILLACASKIPFCLKDLFSDSRLLDG